MRQAVCPRCGSGTDVRTVGELFDLLNSAQDGAMQQAYMWRQAGAGYPGYPGTWSGPATEDPWGDNPSPPAGNGMIPPALGFVGRAIGKRMQRAFSERVVPALQAKAAQAQQQWQQSRAEQAAIVERYPDLRGCLRDEVVFLEGGQRVVPIAEIRMPVTLAAADALVDRLRSP